jgi:hypothetical protein
MNFDNEPLQIVVARYKEPLNWLKDDPFNKYPVIIYNKGGDNNYFKSSNIIKEIKLSNYGLEVHSFLYHIINNYNNLANITAFLQGSIELPNKYNRAACTITESVSRNTSILGVNLSCSCAVSSNFKEDNYNFTMDRYFMSHATNLITDENSKTVPCKFRPFGNWYNELFGNILTTRAAYNHIIAIKREHILRKPIEYYKRLIKFFHPQDLDRQPEVVHYFERAWQAIFFPLDENINCVYVQSR